MFLSYLVRYEIMMSLRNTQHFSIQNEAIYMHFGTVNKLILLQV